MPTSTYRLQLHGGRTLDGAAALAGYLADLGVSHLYCSPYLQAAPGSSHGYDVVDHGRVSEELGGESARLRLVAALRAAGLGQVLDVVPNHVSVAVPRRCAWWWDVLRHGRASRYADRFDVDWEAGGGRVLLPVLADGTEPVADGAVLRCGDLELPLAPGTEGLPLPELLDRQHYRLAHWREGTVALNYRRFFDVATLAGIRVEREDVFADAHRLVGRWLADGSLAGVRVDHPDGLADPAGYAHRLRRLAGPDAWIVVEKVLEPGEALPEDWPVAGTTGYEAASLVGGLFLDPAGAEPLARCYADFTGEQAGWADVAHEAKHAVLRDLFRPEVDRLARLAGAPAATGTREAVVELLACLPVYRTYLRPGEPPGAADRRVLDTALAEAARRRPDLAGPLASLVRRIVAGEPPELTVRFQQTSGPVMAKGVEDTACYRYHRLAALAEVGGDPGGWETPVAAFHDRCAERQRRWPLAMTTLSTHDTKRSEDVRARLAVLSEVPGEWAAAVRRWSAGNERHRTGAWPDRDVEYLLYQTLVGAHPLPLDRALRYAEKAVREAKRHTSWLDPDPAYEEAVRGFVAGALGDAAFVADLDAFVARVAPPARVTSLAQKLVQLTMPGVPDVYQGTELWDHSLVDPDNRRPVDFGLRGRLLGELDALPPEEVGARAAEGLPKLLVTSRALRLRRERPELFGPSGSYAPLEATGPQAGHLVAFVRGGAAATVVPRLAVGLAGGWRGTAVALPPGSWHDVLTGARARGGAVDLDGLLDRFPVALLVREGADCG